jgi:hypothetical protein
MRIKICISGYTSTRFSLAMARRGDSSAAPPRANSSELSLGSCREDDDDGNNKQ